MFADYKAQVAFAYKNKRASGALSLSLSHPTPAKLRAECLMVLSERYLKKDEHALKLFFGLRKDTADYMQAIRKFDADKFKPLDNFLKGVTNDTDDKNIELLAWLIDFNPRPYKFGQGNAASEAGLDTGNGETGNDIPRIEVITGTHVPAVPGIQDNKQHYTSILNPEKGKSDRPAATLNIRNFILYFIGIIILGAGIYFILYYKTKTGAGPQTIIIGKQQCMYWTGDRYQLISCDKKPGDKPVFALDTFRLTHFKRITRPDTVTGKSIGKIWYFKAGDTLQLYNSAGPHPIFMDRRLLPLSIHMLNKYILHIRDTSTEFHQHN